MTRFEWITVVVSVLTLLLLPTIGLVIGLAVRWTRAEDKLQDIASDLNQLTAATDRRLRWLEENIWRRGSRNDR